MHVVKRQAQVLQRLLPGRHGSRRARRGRGVRRGRRLAVARNLLHGVGDIGFRTAKLHAPHRYLVTRQAFLQRRFGLALQLRIDGRVHGVGVRGHVGDAVGLGLAAEKIDKVETDVAALMRVGDELRRLGERLVLLRGVDDAVLLHAAEHVGETILGAIGMAIRIVVIRSLEQARQHGAFADRKILRRFAEIGARRHLDAPRAAAEIGGVQIEFEDFVLAERGLEPRRHDHLADLALVGHVLADQEIFHHLLGDGRAALRPARFAEIADEGADDAALVDAVMLEEAPVLGGDERLLHEVGNVAERDPDAPVAGLEHVGELRARPVQHHRRARQLLALELGRVGQIGRRIVEEVDHLAEIDDRLVDRLVLAELMIGGVEVGEIETVEGLDVGAHGLRIVERGRDEFVEIDRFDIERMRHVGAAVAQQLHDGGLILNRIEMGFHGLRLRRDLAQRECRRKKLDQDGGVHEDCGRAARFEERNEYNGDYSDLILTKRLFCEAGPHPWNAGMPLISAITPHLRSFKCRRVHGPFRAGARPSK